LEQEREGEEIIRTEYFVPSDKIIKAINNTRLQYKIIQAKYSYAFTEYCNNGWSTCKAEVNRAISIVAMTVQQESLQINIINACIDNLPVIFVTPQKSLYLIFDLIVVPMHLFVVVLYMKSK